MASAEASDDRSYEEKHKEDSIPDSEKLRDLIEIKKLGEGQYGAVSLCENKRTKRRVAMKRIPMRHGNGVPPDALREMSVLRNLEHPNIVKLIDILTETDSCICLVLELMDMDLSSYIHMLPGEQPIDRKLIKSYMFQCVSGVKFCHQKEIVHRDLKPANMLIDRKGNLKIADFGMARVISFPGLRPYTPTVVTLVYRAPEVMLMKGTYKSSVDVWSIGTIFAELFRRKILFLGDGSEINQLRKIFMILRTPTVEDWPDVDQFPDFGTIPKWSECTLRENVKGIDDDGYDLLQGMLTCNPEKRISCQLALHHRYFRDVDRSAKPDISSAHC